MAEHRGGSVTTEEFVTHCESVSGHALRELFQGWLWQRQVPALPHDPVRRAEILPATLREHDA